jgi:hypothetical protein
MELEGKDNTIKDNHSIANYLDKNKEDICAIMTLVESKGSFFKLSNWGSFASGMLTFLRQAGHSEFMPEYWKAASSS